METSPMKTSHTPCQIIVLPVPIAGSNSGWDKSRDKLWWDRPRREVDKDEIRRVLEEGNRHLAERKPLIEALLASGRAA
jgi:hypothetical protein